MISWQVRCEAEAVVSDNLARAWSAQAAVFHGLGNPGLEQLYLGMAADCRSTAAGWRTSAAEYGKAAQRVAE